MQNNKEISIRIVFLPDSLREFGADKQIGVPLPK